MGYLDKSGLSRLWSKIKSYVTNHHMPVEVTASQPLSPRNINLTLGQTLDYTSIDENTYYVNDWDGYGHPTHYALLPNFTLPTVECGTFETTSSSGNVTFANMKNTPKLIKIHFIDQSSEYGHSSKELCSVWYDGETVVSTHGAISSVSQTGFSFIGNPGKHYWEAWG